MMQKLFSELRRRNVFRVAGVYAVVGWLLIQVIVAVLPTLGAPPWVAKVLIVAVLSGFPIALVLAWAFELTPDGMKLTKNVPEAESITPKTGRKLDYAIVGGLALVGVMIVADRIMPKKESATPRPESVENAAKAEESKAVDASIAVLPFADLSPAKDQEYFSDGMAEEILNVLAKVEGLSVAARTSSFAFRGRETLGIPAIADELNVRHILEGSVRKSGDTIRITAQLIDSKTDAHLWSETFDRKLTAENVFALQDEISAAIVGALRRQLGLKVGDAATAFDGAKSTADLSAYDLYLRARDLYQRRERLDDAEALLARAVERDPSFADAWALRAATASLYKEYVVTDRTYEELGKLVDDYATKALALDPDNARAIAARANFQITATWNRALKFDIDGVLADLERAVALDPRDSSAANWLGSTYALVGDTKKAVETFRACVSFDPYFGPCAENYYDLLVVNDRWEEALAKYQDVLSKGIPVEGWTNFSMLARFDQKTAFMLATNHPSWLEGWRRHQELYDAFKHPERDHSELIADIEDYTHARGNRGLNPIGNLIVPIGGFDALPYVTNIWAPDYAAYRRSPQFKTYVREIGVFEYWRRHGFPPQCKPVGKDDFECR